MEALGYFMMIAALVVAAAFLILSGVVAWAMGPWLGIPFFGVMLIVVVVIWNSGDDGRGPID